MDLAKIYVESQYDPQRGTVTLIASCAPGDRYAVTVPAASPEAAAVAARQFASLYK